MLRDPSQRSLDEVESRLDAADLESKIDLVPYMNRGCYTVPEHAALTRVYMLFRTMGLRHLPVLNVDGDIVGVITRKDLHHSHDEIESRCNSMSSQSFVREISLPSTANMGRRPSLARRNLLVDGTEDSE